MPSELRVGSGRAVRVWGLFFVLPDRVGFAKLKPVDHPLRWSARAGRLTVLAGGYDRVGRVFFGWRRRWCRGKKRRDLTKIRRGSR